MWGEVRRGMVLGPGAGGGTLQGLRGLVVTKSAQRSGQTRSVGAQTVSLSLGNVTTSPLSPCKNPPRSPRPQHHPPAVYSRRERV